MAITRSVSFIGHSGTGKSTLAEKLVDHSGVDTDVSFDPSEEEQERGYSIDLGVGYVERDGDILNLLDTPGASEFVEEVYKGVFASETALLLVDSEKGTEVQTEQVWGIAREHSQSTMALVNKMDKSEADFFGAVDDLREELTGTFVPMQVPIMENGEFTGVVNLTTLSSTYFDGSSGDVPPDIDDQVNEQRERLLEELAEHDDKLMMQYLEEEEISSEALDRAFASALSAGAFTPVFCASVEDSKGIEPLFNSLYELVPEPSQQDSSSHRSLVFNQLRDPYLGKLSFVKLLSGRLREDDTLYGAGEGNSYEVQDMYRFQGDDQSNLNTAERGDIVALGKLDDLRLGTSLFSNPGEDSLDFVSFPNPIFSRAIEPESQEDETKMSTALKQLSTTKATIEYYRDEVTTELILSGMGTTHLDVFTDRLENGFNVSIILSEPRIPYKQSISQSAKAQHRHKKQSGGRGQYAEVYLEVKPRQRGEGFKFTNNIKGGTIPQQFIPGVEKGIQQALTEDYPITDLEAIAYDGDHHPVDSSEMAFKIAGREVTKKAVDKANLILLEPIMSMEVSTPGDYMGDINRDLSGRRGRILGTDMAGSETVIKAEVPQAEVLNYALELKSLTQGRASFQMEFLRYQKVPDNIAQQLMSEEE